MNSTMMGHFMTELGRNSLQAATLVLAVLLVQWASGKRLTPHWRCALWLVVVVRLLVPISLGSTTSLFNIWSPALLWMQQITSVSAQPAPVQTPLHPFSETLTTSVLSPRQEPPRPIKPQAVEAPKNIQPVPRQPLLVPATNLPLSVIVMPKQTLSPSKSVPQPSIQESPQKTASTPSVHHAVFPPETNPSVVPMVPSETHFMKQSAFNLPPWPVTLFWLWLAGAMIMLGHLVISSVRLGQRCSRLRPLSDVTSLAVLKECCQAMDMPPHLMAPGNLVIVESMEVSSPALHGLLHPRLLLPKGFTSKFSPEELKFVFLHELAHLKRRDLWMNWVMALLQAVHWFNPLVWFCFARWREDRELACDAMVLEATGAEHNQEYGETILRLLENFTPPVRTPALVGILEDKRQLHHRIGMIAAYAPTPRWSWLAMVLIAVLTAVGLTDARSDNPTNNITAAAKDEPLSQLTLELRDGSRVVGKSLDDPLKFHSPSLGDFKLPVAGIRSIEFTGKGDGTDNTGRLTATNGDVLDVQLVAPSLHLQTSFGKSELPVKMIRSIKISSVGQPGQLAADFPSSLVALWSGNWNGHDSAGTNNAIVPAGITYAPAQLGDGFQFDGNTGGLTVPASPELNVGAGPGFTLSCWIKPTSIATQQPLIEWRLGTHFWISVRGTGCLYANIADAGGVFHTISSANGIIQPNIFQYVAMTYDKATGIGSLYYNGSLVASQNLGIFTPKSDSPLLIGERLDGEEIRYQGILNQISIFNRALSTDEIQAIYAAQSKEVVVPNATTPSIPSAKPLIPSTPASTNETDSQFTLELRDGSRVVGKSLDDPLKFHSASLGDFKLPVAGIRSIKFIGKGDGADNTARLTAINGDVIDVQFVAPSLHVQTGFGKSELPVKMIRSIKVSTAGQPGQLATDFPSGLVALWSGNGNGDDSVGSNNAILTDITFTDWQEGKVFSFNGISSCIKIPASSSLNVGASEGMTVSAWINPADVSRIQPILDWNDGAGVKGTHFYIATDAGPGSLYACIIDINGVPHPIHSFSAPLKANIFQNVALTYDKTSGVAKIYCQGVKVAEQMMGSFTPQTTYDVYLGRRPPFDGENFIYTGAMRGVSIFKRALSADEIQAIYAAQNQGTVVPNALSTPLPLPSEKPSIPSTPASTNETGAQFTLELRDGSRVVGKCLDDPLKFHSASLGDFKLPVVGIRSIEFTGKGDGSDNTARLTATNGDVIDVDLVAPTLHVQTGFGKSELPVKMIRSIKVSSTGTAEQSSGRLINVDFGSGGARGYSQKTGFAAIGQTPDDFWNFYDRDLSTNPNDWRRSGALPNLKLASGETTQVGMSVSDAAGAWSDDSTDPMYRTYDYPLDGGNDIVAFTGLPPGQYEVLAYSPDGNYELTVGGATIQKSPVNINSDEKSIEQPGFRQSGPRLDSLNMPMLSDELAVRKAMLIRIDSGNSELIVGGTSYGVRTTRDEPVNSVPAWTEGTQYARWQNVTVNAGEPLYLTVRNGKGGCAMLSGIQILSSGPAGQEQTPDANFVPKYNISGDWCENPGNPSDHSTAHCVGKHVVFDCNNNNYEHHFEGDYVTDHTIVGTQSRRKRTNGTTTQMRLTINLSSPDLATVQWVALDSNSDLSQGQTGSSIIHKIIVPEHSTEPWPVGTSATSTAATSTNDSILQLTLELRDGSRVVGKCLDDPLKFHSASLGDFRLAVTGIRSIEFSDKGDDDSARLTATNGDVIDVQFVAPSLHVQTGFGKSELPVKMIRNIKVSSVGPAGSAAADFPSGLVALWSGNGNGHDSVGTNNAIVPAGITYAPAKVGDGFQFDGNSGGLSVPASPELNVGTGPGFTLSCWIAPTSVTSRQPLLEWQADPSRNNYETRWGVHLWVAESFQGVGGSGSLYANVTDTDGQSHFFASPLGTIQAGIFQQVTLTYDKATGMGSLYYNGSLVASQNLGIFTPQTDRQLLIGERKELGDVYYQGVLSDIAIFNRALSVDEIQKMYTEQSGAESAATPPPIVNPPAIFPRANLSKAPFSLILNTISKRMEDVDTLLKKAYG